MYERYGLVQEHEQTKNVPFYQAVKNLKIFLLKLFSIDFADFFSCHDFFLQRPSSYSKL